VRTRWVLKIIGDPEIFYFFSAGIWMPLKLCFNFSKFKVTNSSSIYIFTCSQQWDFKLLSSFCSAIVVATISSSVENVVAISVAT
jgi:hypothetical protein